MASINTKSHKIGLWRTNPSIKTLKQGEEPFKREYIFPSARQALSYSLSYAGLSRFDRIAFPEWSSHCVVNAIGRFSTPLPIKEVLQYKINVSAVLIYEQWGWPIASHIIEELEDHFKDKIIILDMVDSAHFTQENNFIPQGVKALFRITSLSKLLGISGGGLALYNRDYLRFESNEESERILAYFMNNNFFYQSLVVEDFRKSNVGALDFASKKWVQENDVFGAIDLERTARIENLNKLLSNPITNGWPDWMIEAVTNGAGPGIAPLLRKYPEDVLLKIKEALLSFHNIETEIYHFNWSGNPLKQGYEKCLAFPIHGMINNLSNILEDINLWLWR
jgi:hypothetical protein